MVQSLGQARIYTIDQPDMVFIGNEICLKPAIAAGMNTG